MVVSSSLRRRIGFVFRDGFVLCMAWLVVAASLFLSQWPSHRLA
jgi:hypothetical protein